MTSLRQQMIDAMAQRGFSNRTHETYLGAINKMALYFHQPPDQLEVKQLQQYFVYLVKERGLSGATCRLYLNAIRFLYLNVLQWPEFNVPIHYPKKAQKIPELLTHTEVKAIIDACSNPRHRMMLLTCYGCGLRVSELVALKVRHIDGERHLLRVEQGKGAKDRSVVLSPRLLDALRQYWRIYRPNPWLFPNTQKPTTHLDISTPQRAFTIAKTKVGIPKIGGIHSLRHAYATHQLESGLPVHKLQHQLGHQDIRSTLRYVHWVPNTHPAELPYVDLLAKMAVDHD